MGLEETLKPLVESYLKDLQEEPLLETHITQIAVHARSAVDEILASPPQNKTS